MKNRNTIFRTILLALACFALLPPNAFGVVPAPDGGYGPPAYGTGNTAEGQNALLSLTTGSYNTGVGLLSLRSNTTTSLNTAIGAGALLANTADQNTATGAVALFHNTTGPFNTANGAFALFSNTTGYSNSAFGRAALQFNTTGFDNTANGINALLLNTAGQDNTANGSGALQNNTTGNANTASGFHALISNTGGGQPLGSYNTAIGSVALNNNATGYGNTAIGYQSLYANTTGFFNTALGDSAGANLTTGSNNIDIGHPGFAGESNTIRIGSLVLHTRTFMAGIRDVTTGNADAIPVLIDSAGQLGTANSSRRFKKEIKAMDKASEAILALKPVTFHYKSDKTDTPQFGLIAEDVAAVNADLVVRDKNGDIYTVRYDAVNAMLLNEFLKEHRKNEEQEKTIAELKSGMTALAATVKEQAAQIRKVSAQVELNRPARQIALD